ncbi:transmembrane protein adipocyte-associated 1 homolog [Dreissena polymorpha]|uniref:Transmembrane protein adipocyte-associated 1 homolog n=1 Tax=Dreissena polymorpha TaxID=45954 RepID=A0A9D4GN47_DREPO|nr:transmembrane protein adipocyte-associated 1 homolog [Dreissena polymorpha]XP_052284576.1 transmembrane protein adipocyte-associated 1 homolog [Dreissena polymorpha]XP_052284577.1 transmembrane protein adipocyte-associated 1 homolog [Dreissena polymorpha]KAH3820224.1 hypothetical protein DPMN_121968 [Dreissena polymorpha]
MNEMESLRFEPADHIEEDMGSAKLNNITGLGDNLGNVSTTTSGGFAPAVIEIEYCQWILYQEIQNSRVRIWDLMILVPNALFVMFLLWTLRPAIARLRQTSSPIFAAFYLLVLMAGLISILRCVVAMTVNATVLAGDITDKVIWLVLRFFLLATEMSVVVFGLAFGHLDSKTSIRRVLMVTFSFAFVYSSVQGILELIYPDPKFHIQAKNYDIFAHGGMIFWMSSSIFFCIVYGVVVILPCTRLKDRLQLPSKRSFYIYILILCVLNMTQVVGSTLLYKDYLKGLCIVDVTTYLYFAFFDPLVYCTFLRQAFSSSGNAVPQYKYQIDETTDDDVVSLPPSDDKYPRDNLSDSGSFDSTHFDRHSGAYSVNADVYTTANSYQNV